jgi:hypothetical protein
MKVSVFMVYCFWFMVPCSPTQVLAKVGLSAVAFAKVEKFGHPKILVYVLLRLIIEAGWVDSH